MFSFTEDTFEQAVIELFENMGYTHIYAPDMDRTDYSRPLLDDVLRDCLVRLNRNLPVTAIDEAILKLNDFDMWLTGFDVPSLATMYIYKPMHGYNLMQAIARVNRVFKDKEGGLIVDYVGIASALKAAMKEYTKRDQSRYGDMDISKVAYPKFQEKLQVCKDLLHGFDFSGFIGGSPLIMAKLVTGGVNFALDAKAPKRKDLFLREAMLLKQSHSLCSSMTTEQERHEAAYIENRFFWMSCEYDDAVRFRDYVIDKGTGERMPNPRSKDQVEPRQQFFA